MRRSAAWSVSVARLLRDPTSVFVTEEDLSAKCGTSSDSRNRSVAKWARHPLSYLVEAADDICYSILDVEDAIELGILQFGDVRGMFQYLCGPECRYRQGIHGEPPEFPRFFLSSIRGLAIQNLIDDVARVFAEHYEQIMNGELDKSLIALSTSDTTEGIRIGKRLGRERIYPDRRKTELEVGSYDAQHGARCARLRRIWSSVWRQDSYRAERIVRLIGAEKLGRRFLRGILPSGSGFRERHDGQLRDVSRAADQRPRR